MARFGTGNDCFKCRLADFPYAFRLGIPERRTPVKESIQLAELESKTSRAERQISPSCQQVMALAFHPLIDMTGQRRMRTM